MRQNIEFQIHSFSSPTYWAKFLRHMLPLLAAGLLFSALWIVVAIVISKGTNTPLSYMTRDTAAILNVSMYYGLISNIGLMLWAASSAICIVGAVILFDQRKRLALMLLASGIISGIMNIDDAFMFHERILPHHFGISEKIVMLSYVVYILAFLFYFRKEIFETDFPVFGIALISFGMSSMMDFILEVESLNTFMEDGFKFTGIVLWFIYFSYVTITSIRQQLKTA